MSNSWFSFKLEDPDHANLVFAYHLFGEHSSDYIPNIVGNYFIGETNIRKIKFGIQNGETYFTYKDTPCRIQVDKNYPPMFNGGGLDMWCELNIGIFVETSKQARDLLEEFASDAIKYGENKTENKISIWSYKNGWHKINKLDKRSMSTIYLNSKEKQKIINDVNQFITDKSDYTKFGIPYKRNYLLYGPPGSGKTSMIFALASMLDKEIFTLNLSSIKDETKLIEAICNMNSNCITVFEDIDAVFVNRESTSSVSLSTILNILDGLCHKHGAITFMTANHINTLDAALLRPGRIDFKMEFTSASYEQIRQMFNHFLPNNTTKFDEFYEIIKGHNVNMSLVQKFLFDHRKDPSILTFKKELSLLVIQYETKAPTGYI